MKKKIVIPGPVELTPEVLQAMAAPIMGHRTPDFEDILNECWNALKEIYQTKNDIALITGSGTSAMDGAISSTITGGDNVISITGGKFAERMRDQAIIYGAQVTEVPVEWGKTFEEAELERIVEKSRPKAITLTHNETSTGVVHDAKTVGKIAKDNDALFIMDGVTSIGGDKVKTDKWGVDLGITGSQKSLAAPPGLAFVSISKKAREVMDETPVNNYYLDLRKYKKALDKNTTPFTPSVSLIYGLYEALNHVLEEGIEKRIKRHRTLAKATREAMRAMNVNMIPEESIASNTVSAMWIPEGLDDSSVRGVMKDKFGILLAGGQEHFKGNIFRIGHMGNVEYSDLMQIVASLELTLKRAGHNLKLGDGLAAAQEVFKRV